MARAFVLCAVGAVCIGTAAVQLHAGGGEALLREAWERYHPDAMEQYEEARDHLDSVIKLSRAGVPEGLLLRSPHMQGLLAHRQAAYVLAA